MHNYLLCVLVSTFLFLLFLFFQFSFVVDWIEHLPVFAHLQLPSDRFTSDRKVHPTQNHNIRHTITHTTPTPPLKKSLLLPTISPTPPQLPPHHTPAKTHNSHPTTIPDPTKTHLLPQPPTSNPTTPSPPQHPNPHLYPQLPTSNPTTTPTITHSLHTLSHLTHNPL